MVTYVFEVTVLSALPMHCPLVGMEVERPLSSSAGASREKETSERVIRSLPVETVAGISNRRRSSLGSSRSKEKPDKN